MFWCLFCFKLDDILTGLSLEIEQKKVVQLTIRVAVVDLRWLILIFQRHTNPTLLSELGDASCLTHLLETE